MSPKITVGKKLLLSCCALLACVFALSYLALSGSKVQTAAAGAENGTAAGPHEVVVGVLIAISLAAGTGILAVIRFVNHELRLASHELGQDAEQVSHAAAQVAHSSQSLAQGATEQAACFAETSSASEAIHQMAQESARKSEAAAGLVAKSHQKFTEANQRLDQMIEAVTGITASSEKVSKIIKVIDEIAFQTNILALNAAVEAARAGEAGMGFAVVADEVRTLAQRSAQAAHDTAPLIEEAIAKSQDAKLRVEQAAVAIRSITEDAAGVKILVDEMSLGSQEQTNGVTMVSQAIAQMQQITESSAASAEQSAAAAEQLTAQATALKEVVLRLTALVGAA